MNITCFVKDVVATHPGVLLANLSMLSTQYPWGRNDHRSQAGNGAGIGLSTDLDTLVICEADVFYERVGVEV
jgi:hypothetical protein